MQPFLKGIRRNSRKRVSEVMIFPFFADVINNSIKECRKTAFVWTMNQACSGDAGEWIPIQFQGGNGDMVTGMAIKNGVVSGAVSVQKKDGLPGREAGKMTGTARVRKRSSIIIRGIFPRSWYARKSPAMRRG